MSVFLIASASSTVLPLSHSVARLELAIAEPQPNVLNFASSMTPVVGVHLDLQLHDVAALRRADQAGADVRIVLSQRADVARVLVVVDDFVRVSHCCLSTSAKPTFNLSVLRSVRCPLHRREIDAFFRHLVERRHLAQPRHDVRSACPPRSRLLPRWSSGRGRSGSTSAPGRRRRRAPSARSDGSRLADVQAEPDDTATSLMPISSDSPSTYAKLMFRLCGSRCSIEPLM